MAGPKVKRLCSRDSPDNATSVYTVEGRYTARGWTEWTQGFLYGEAILQFDATGDEEALDLARGSERMRVGTWMGVSRAVHDAVVRESRTGPALLWGPDREFSLDLD